MLMDNNNLMICSVIGLLVIGIIICVVVRNQTENFGAPNKIIRYGNYHFNDHGFGSHLYQTDWTRGAFFQPFVPLDQGLYTSNEWSPRYIRHEQQNYVPCCSK